MASDQDDVDDLFGLGSVSPPPASPVAPGAPPPAGAESRKESRVRANWQARVLLPDGSFRALRVHDLAESGVGFVSDVGIPANSVLTFAIAVPDLNEPTRLTTVTGTLKTTHMTVRGPDIHCGGLWVSVSSAHQELVNRWIRHLRK